MLPARRGPSGGPAATPYGSGKPEILAEYCLAAEGRGSPSALSHPRAASSS